MNEYPLVDLAQSLASRLERMSADSYWAHQASGLRGALLRSLERFEAAGDWTDAEAARLEALIERGFDILEKAALELI